MDHLKHHLKHMAIATAIILVVLAIAGVDLGQALRSAAILACPLGMLAMMFMMRGHGGRPTADHDSADHTVVSTDSPAQNALRPMPHH